MVSLTLSWPTTDSTAPGESFREFFEHARRVPVFVILGVQGSGTNLLGTVLAGAFGFCVIQDQSIVFSAAAQLGPNPARGDVRRRFHRLRARLLPSAVRRKTSKIVKSNSDFSAIADYFDSVDLRSGADFARFVYGYGAFRRCTTLMAIKSDDLWENIDAIDTVLPNRRIVLLTRDFRDNLLSITRKDFGPIEPLVAAKYVHDRFERYEREFDQTPEDYRLHVRYEDLLADPHAFVERFGLHFGLAPAQNGHAAVERLPIRRNNVSKWGELDSATLAGCEAILRSELERYGYGVGPGTIAPSAGMWALARSRDVLRRVPQKMLKVSTRLRR